MATKCSHVINDIIIAERRDSWHCCAMYIESVPNRNSPPAILLRESYRDGGKIKKRTIANLSDWPTEIVEGLRTLLKGGKVAPAGQETIVVRRALPHGHVAAVLGALRDIALDRLLGPAGNRCRDLVIAMIVARLIGPASKLATARMLDPLTAASSLGEVLGLGPVDEDELYVALDWLGERQPAVETALARKHLRDGMLVLYDVSSSYVEGRCCELAQRGYNRDGKKGKLQIVYGLLCAPDGCPVAIEVFEGDTADPRTLAAQIDKVKKRFALAHVVLVGDRGMITQARIDAEIAPAGLDWITALRAPAIRELADAGALHMSLFDACLSGCHPQPLAVVWPCSWTFTSVAIFGSHNRCQSSSDFSLTIRPVPATWRRLAGATGSFAPIVRRRESRSASQIVLASCAAAGAAVIRR